MRAFLALLVAAVPAVAADPPKPNPAFDQKNLVAWCIVPFDSAKRTPKQRVEMLQRLGFTRFAYDWRAEHLPSFPEELDLLAKAGISLQGVWFPAAVGKDGEFILNTLKAKGVKTELWTMLPQPQAKEQDDKVKETAALVSKLAMRAAEQGCKVGIYNHGGWTGVPENMAAVAKASGEPNVGIVYNLHHSTGNDGTFEKLGELFQPNFYCVNLNGYDPDAVKAGDKAVLLGDGLADRELLADVAAHYSGPLGILGHTQDDAEDRLFDNLAGFRYLTQPDDGHLRRWYPAYRTRQGNSLNIRFAGGKVVVSGSDKQLRDLKDADAATLNRTLRVFVEKPGVGHADLWEEGTPLAGSAEFQPNTLTFTPRFPLEPGLSYRAIFNILNGEKPNPLVTFTSYGYYAAFTVPKAAQEKATTVEAISPSAATLPENALRMYIHFSAPMKPGTGQKFLKLTCDGKPVIDPFLHIEQELWSADGRRLTVFFDPARVKRGLKPREEAGPILVEGKKHTLTVEAAWPDAAGFPLKEAFTYSFDVGPPDETPIDPSKWTITPPTKDAPPSVVFEKMLDKALAERLIWVADAAGKKLDLKCAATADQKGVTLGVAGALPPGQYKLVIDTRLEDVCGNRVGEAFEVDEFRPVTKVIEGTTVERAFVVK